MESSPACIQQCALGASKNGTFGMKGVRTCNDTFSLLQLSLYRQLAALLSYVLSLMGKTAGLKPCGCSEVFGPVACANGETYGNKCEAAECAEAKGCTGIGRDGKSQFHVYCNVCHQCIAL